ncbi:MAG: YkvA family protein [Alphaproteobacteria bacterium]|nr:YkvA family protein [Alphaproteobacteria bacterium]
MLLKLKSHLSSAARLLKRAVAALYHALRDRRAPWSARVVGAVTLAYALSPIDLIPDFIPVLGLLDDLILVPAGLWLTWRLMPPALRGEYLAKAETYSEQLPQSRAAAAVIVCLWLLSLYLLYRAFA